MSPPTVTPPSVPTLVKLLPVTPLARVAPVKFAAATEPADPVVS